MNDDSTIFECNSEIDKLYIIWQGCQSAKITFDELEKVDVQEIRKLLDVQEYNDSQ